MKLLRYGPAGREKPGLLDTHATRGRLLQVPFLISYLSRFMSLQSGDVISTGTPPGVGMGQKPPVFLRAGQTMHLGIAGLGTQTQRLVQAR